MPCKISATASLADPIPVRPPLAYVEHLQRLADRLAGNSPTVTRLKK